MNQSTRPLNTGSYPNGPAGAEPAGSNGRHPLNITHLVMGIAFLGFVGIWAAITSDLVPFNDLRWLLPVPWVLAGLGGLLAISFNSRHSTRQ